MATDSPANPPSLPLGTALVLALTLIAYLPALGGGFIWDDDDYVTQNLTLRTLGGLREIWLTPTASPQYYPMVFTTFWIEHQLWGLRPFGYHLTNVLLHALASVLLWRLLIRLEVPAALLTACLFAVHPVMVESVAWISERKNVLSAVFYVASALAYVTWVSRPSAPQEEKQKSSGKVPKPRQDHLLYALAMLLFVLALLSKTVTCTLPAALLLLIWWKRGQLTQRDVFPLLPMFVIGVTMGLLTVYLEIQHVRAIGPEWDFGFFDRLLIAGRAIWFYATTILLPFNLSFIYPRWAIDPRSAWQWAFPLGVIAAIVVLWRMRERWGRGPIVAALFFIGTLFPALGFFNVWPMRYTFVADHYQYHASIGLLALIAIGLQRLARRWRTIAPTAIVCAALLVLTLMRSATFRNAEILWRDTLAKNPHSWMVHLNLARALAERGKVKEASEFFHSQARLAPHLPETRWQYGADLARRGHLDAALAEFTEAIRLDPFEPLPQAFFGRGNVYWQKGDLAAAEAEFRQAIDHKQDYAEAYFNLGRVLLLQGATDAAESAFTRAIDIRPGYALAHNELGQILVRRRQFQPALEHYLAAIEADGEFAQAHLNLAALLAAIGQMGDAQAHFKEAVRLDPSLERFADQVLRTGQ